MILDYVIKALLLCVLLEAAAILTVRLIKEIKLLRRNKKNEKNYKEN